MKKIDVHVHSSMWSGTEFNTMCHLIAPDEIRETYKKLDIEKGFLLPIVSPECRTYLQTNEEAQYLAKKNSDILYWFCNIDPRMIKNSPTADFSEILTQYKNLGAIGVGEVTANLYVDEPMMDNLFYHCAETDMPVTIHMAAEKYNNYGIVDEIGLPRLEKMLKKYPRLKILGHSMCFWSEISDNVTPQNRALYVEGKANGGRVAELLRNYPNLYCDLSAGSGFNALNRDTDHAISFIEEFSDRLLYGTDLCRVNQETYLAAWLDDAYEKGHITKENYAKICRENAIKLFNLNI